MKLYATTTSERASKGQGGNEFLNIEIMAYDQHNPRYTIEITQDSLIFRERGYSQPLLERSHKDLREQEENRKSKKLQTATVLCDMEDCGYDYPHTLKLHDN